MQKCISISDEDLSLLREYRDNKGFKTDSQAISFLIRQEKESLASSIASAVWEEFEKRYSPYDSKGGSMRNGN